MSITAQVDTASIDVSIDMHELRTEIRELVTEELDSEEANNPKIKEIEYKLDSLHKRVDELTARIVGAGCMLTGTRT